MIIKNEILKIVIIIVLIVILGVYLLVPETRGIYEQAVPYQDPVYRTEYYQEPVYGTLYSGIIGRWHYLSGIKGEGENYTINNAISTTWTVSSENHGNTNYTVYVCWIASCQYYYDIEYNQLQPSTGITGYETKSRQVFVYNVTKFRTNWKDVTKTKLEWFYYDIQHNWIEDIPKPKKIVEK